MWLRTNGLVKIEIWFGIFWELCGFFRFHVVYVNPLFICVDSTCKMVPAVNYHSCQPVEGTWGYIKMFIYWSSANRPRQFWRKILTRTLAWSNIYIIQEIDLFHAYHHKWIRWQPQHHLHWHVLWWPNYLFYLVLVYAL